VGHVAYFEDETVSKDKNSKKKISNRDYEKELADLQIELVKLQEWIKEKGLKVVCIFEGRDAAGKGGVIKRITESLNPRICRVVALGTPTEREKTQWYFQRYVPHLPAAGEMVLFDRSWYNRAGVEHVMGFCTEEEYQEFMRTCPEFERMLVRSGIIHQGPDQALETEPDGCRITQQVGRVLQGQGPDVRPYRHQAGAVVRGQCGHQETRPPELHQAPVEHDSLR
jgi:hypothetical protein